MIRFSFRLSLLSVAISAASLHAQPATKALAGGTLIDGHGGRPLRDSVILIEGERIKQIGRVGEVQIPPGAEAVAHAHRPDEIRRGLQAGADVFEHTGPPPGTPCLLSDHPEPPPHPGAQVPAAPRIRRHSPDRHRQRHPDEVAQPIHLE